MHSFLHNAFGHYIQVSINLCIVLNSVLVCIWFVFHSSLCLKVLWFWSLNCFILDCASIQSRFNLKVLGVWIHFRFQSSLSLQLATWISKRTKTDIPNKKWEIQVACSKENYFGTERDSNSKYFEIETSFKHKLLKLHIQKWI